MEGVAIRAGLRGSRSVIEDVWGTEPWRARILATGALARVALVQTRASLLGGDDVELSIAVGDGAALEIVELGATLAHDVRGGPGTRIRVEIQVGAGGRFVWIGEPLIVAAGASVQRSTTVELAGSARALLGEAIVFGRSGEHPGALVARTRIACERRTTVDETLDTRDRSTLRSAVVAGDARMISSLTLAGIRDQSPPAGSMQAHGPATLWRSVGRAVAGAQEATGLGARWRRLVLDELRVPRAADGDAALGRSSAVALSATG
jgi:urease accessory protein